MMRSGAVSSAWTKSVYLNANGQAPYCMAVIEIAGPGPVQTGAAATAMYGPNSSARDNTINVTADVSLIRTRLLMLFDPTRANTSFSATEIDLSITHEEFR